MRLLLLIPLLLVLSSCLTEGGDEIRLVYLIPAGKPELPHMEEGARNALRHLQRWYQKEMGDGLTFAISDQPMIVVHSAQHEDWFRQNPSDEDPDFYPLINAINEVRSATRFSRDRFVILLDADVEGRHAGAAANRGGKFAVMPWRYARAYAGQNIQPTCEAVGVMGHELGHIFGLEHPKGCVSSEGYRTNISECDQIMMWGGHDYPRTSLSSVHKSQLRVNPMFRKRELPASSDFECDRLLGNQ